MAKHEFGIMPDAPLDGKRYDEYEPQKYACIAVNDDYIQKISPRLESLDFYWHTVSVKGHGLAYYGITLIPPGSLKAFIDAISDTSELYQLKNLLKVASDNDKWVIHYGI